MDLPPKTLKSAVLKKAGASPRVAVLPGENSVSQPSAYPAPVVETSTVDGGHALNRPVDRALVAKQESLPVLEAFHEFLENERRRTRARIIVISSVFVLILICVVGVGALVGLGLYRQMKADYSDIQGELARVRLEAESSKKEAASLLERIGSESGELRNALDRDRQAMLASSSALASRIENYDDELDSLKELVSMLETENTFLHDDRRPPAEGAAQEGAGPAVALTSSPGETGSADEGAAAPGPRTLVMSVAPQGLNRTVPWRLPIPE